MAKLMEKSFMNLYDAILVKSCRKLFGKWKKSVRYWIKLISANLKSQIIMLKISIEARVCLFFVGNYLLIYSNLRDLNLNKKINEKNKYIEISKHDPYYLYKVLFVKYC